MRQFLTVFKFEFFGFLKEKGYIISTFCLCLLIGIVFFFPRFINAYEEGIKGTSAVSESEYAYALYDPMNVLTEETFLQAFPNSSLIRVDSLEVLKQNVEHSKVVAGYYLKSELEYEYYVKGHSIQDAHQKYFENLIMTQYRNKELASFVTDVDRVNQILSTSLSGNMVILGKGGYIITYAMVMLIYVLIVLYGSLVSTRVASEKSNRAIEILVTSTSSHALIFGKVLASAFAGLFQVGIVMITAYVCYQLNIVYWDIFGSILAQFSLPIVLVFILFGLFGYLLYSFMFGALGALVDKTEDVNASITPLMLIFIISFLITISNLSNIDGMIIKIASFVPFSSCLAMLARITTGNVMLWEIIVSLIILVFSTWIIAIIGAKIYRRGTLMYGNKGKIWNILRMKE